MDPETLSTIGKMIGFGIGFSIAVWLVRRDKKPNAE